MTAPPAGALEACLALLIEQMDMLRDDFVSYSDGKPTVPFVVLREALIAALNAYDEARPALLAALRLREWWRPIESAPKDGTSVLVHGTSWIGEPMICEWDMTYGGWFVTGYGDGVSPAPTHWMPLPAPPTADDLARILESER